MAGQGRLLGGGDAWVESQFRIGRINQLKGVRVEGMASNSMVYLENYKLVVAKVCVEK